MSSSLWSPAPASAPRAAERLVVPLLALALFAALLLLFVGVLQLSANALVVAPTATATVTLTATATNTAAPPSYPNVLLYAPGAGSTGVNNNPASALPSFLGNRPSFPLPAGQSAITEVIGAQNAAECAQMCLGQQPSCRAYTFYPSTNGCQLYQYNAGQTLALDSAFPSGSPNVTVGVYDPVHQVQSDADVSLWFDTTDQRQFAQPTDPSISQSATRVAGITKLDCAELCLRDTNCRAVSMTLTGRPAYTGTRGPYASSSAQTQDGARHTRHARHKTHAPGCAAASDSGQPSVPYSAQSYGNGGGGWSWSGGNADAGFAQPAAGAAAPQPGAPLLQGADLASYLYERGVSVQGLNETVDLSVGTGTLVLPADGSFDAADVVDCRLYNAILSQANQPTSAAVYIAKKR